MRTSTRCDRGAPNWRTRFASSVKIFLTLFLLSSFLIPSKTFAQTCPSGATPIVADGNPAEWNSTNVGLYPISTGIVADPYGNTVDNRFITGSKDFFKAGCNTNGCLAWDARQTKDKNDITNAVAILCGGHLYFAGDRTSNNGDAQIGFWFFLGGTAPASDGTFQPAHTIGDILVLANFTGGGKNGLVTVFRWVGSGGNAYHHPELDSLTGISGIVAENNDGPATVPSGWQYPTTTFDINSFYEGDINLSSLNITDFCFSSVLLEARSSQSLDASLDDFVAAPFNAKPNPSFTATTVCLGNPTVFTNTTSPLNVNTYSWNFGDGGSSTQTSPQHQYAAAGIYQVILTAISPTGCSVNDTMNVTVNANPAPTAHNLTSCETGSTGSASVNLSNAIDNASGGTISFYTSLADAQAGTNAIATPSAYSVNVGTVTIYVRSTSGTCFGTTSFTVTVNANPTANAGPDQAKCQTGASGPTSFTLAGTASNGTTAWTQVNATGTASASITTPTSLTSTVSVSGIGTVTLRLTTTSASCGTATDDVVLTVNANPTANAGPDQTLCQTAPSGPTSFTLAGTASNGTTAWSVQGATGGASATIADPTSLTSTVSVSGIGTVTLRLTTTSASCGAVTDDVVLAVNANPTANAGPDQAQCQTKPSGPTMFTLAGSASNGTTAWTQVGQTGTANASITTPSSLTSTVSVSGTGTVTLRLTTTSNATPSCGTATDDVVLTVNANPAPTAHNLVSCETGSTGSASFNLNNAIDNNGGGTVTFYTSQADANAGTNAIATPTSYSVNVGSPATIYVRSTSGTCFGTTSFTATVNANPTANAGPDQTKCQTGASGPTSFTLAGTASNGTTAWTQIGQTGTASASITTPSSLTSTVSVSGIGTVTLRLTTTSGTGCGTATDDVVLTVNANPTANAGPDQTKCQTKPSGPTSFTLAGTASNGTTAWTQVGQTGTANASITTPSSLTSTVSVSGIGTVTLRLTTTSGTGCGTVTDDVVLTVVANATNNAGPDQTLCQTAPSGPTMFTLAGTAANGTSTWSQFASTGTASASITTPSSLTSTVSVSGIGTVTLRLTTVSDCGTVTDDVVLTVNANPTANAGPDQTKCQTAPSGPTSFTLAGTASNGTTAWTQVASTGGASATITTPSSLTSTVSVSGIGTVTLRLTTTSGTGCGTVTDDVILTVNANPTANAGPDQTQCRTASGTNTFGTNTFTLAGSASNGTTAWSIAPGGNPQGYTVNIVTPTSLTSSVQISGNSVNGGTVTLRLTTTSASCGTATDDVVLTLTPLPIIYTVTGTNFCPNAPSTGTITLSGSEVGVNYQLSKDGVVQVGQDKAGTGSPLVWTGLDAGNYSVIGTRIGTSCSTTSGPDDVAENNAPDPSVHALTSCENGTTGGASFNLNDAITSADGGTVTFYNTQADAIAKTNAINASQTVTVAASPKTFWVRSENATTGCFGVSSFTVSVTDNPDPTVQNLTSCETGTTGHATFDLNNGVTGADGGTVSFYASQADANVAANALSGVSTYSAPVGTTTIWIRDANGTCATVASFTVTVNANPTPTADNKSVCNTESVTLTGSPAGGVWSGANVSGSTFNAAGLTPGDYTVTYTVTDAFGCTGSTTATVTVNNCRILVCSYTQGFWGNKNGLALLKTSGILNTPITIGNPAGNSIVIPANDASNAVANKLNSIMPGGNTPVVLLGYHNLSIMNFTTSNYLTKQGRINNVLLSQTITLALNSRLNSGILATIPLSTCMIINGDTMTMSQNVIDYLTAHYTANVAGLLQLANDVLGGVGPTGAPSPADVNAAVDKINTGFDECKYFYGSCTAPITSTKTLRTNVTASEVTTKFDKLTVSAYPNPFNDVVRFTIQSKVAGNAQLVVYNMLGQKVSTVYNGFVQANKAVQVEYRAPLGAQQNLIYILAVNGEKVTGKLLNTKQ